MNTYAFEEDHDDPILEECNRCGDELPPSLVFRFGICSEFLCIGCVRKIHRRHFCTRGIPSGCLVCDEAQKCEHWFAQTVEIALDQKDQIIETEKGNLFKDGGVMFDPAGFPNVFEEITQEKIRLTQWTPEPWMFNKFSGRVFPAGDNDETVTICYGEDGGSANSARIVACVNACEGLNPEAVPELLAACKHFVSTLESDDKMTSVFDDVKTLKIIKQAIAKAKGEA